MPQGPDDLPSPRAGGSALRVMVVEEHRQQHEGHEAHVLLHEGKERAGL
jgi:hypothetical protein